jgi:hypothetical protein
MSVSMIEMASLQQSQLGGTLCSHQCAQLTVGEPIRALIGSRLGPQWLYSHAASTANERRAKAPRGFTKRRFTAQRHTVCPMPPTVATRGRTAGMDRVLRPAHIRLFGTLMCVRACVREPMPCRKTRADPRCTIRSARSGRVGRSALTDRYAFAPRRKVRTVTTSARCNGSTTL